MEWKEKNVLVIGTGISGIAATDLLIQVGAKVFLFDGNEEIKEEERVEIIVKALEEYFKKVL